MVVSDFKRPASEFWKEDSLVITNTDDLMAEIAHFTRDVVSNFKVCKCFVCLYFHPFLGTDVLKGLLCCFIICLHRFLMIRSQRNLSQRKHAHLTMTQIVVIVKKKNSEED